MLTACHLRGILARRTASVPEKPVLKNEGELPEKLRLIMARVVKKKQKPDLLPPKASCSHEWALISSTNM